MSNNLEIDGINDHTFSVVVDNESGVLHRVVGLFSGRGYNIDSLTVSEIDRDEGYSKITIVTSGTAPIIAQIRAQLERLVPVRKVSDLTRDGRSVQRELALIKVQGTGEKRIAAMELADKLNAQVVDSTAASFVFEIVGSSETLDRFIDEVKQLGLVDVSRTGIVAIARGAEGM